MFVRIHPHEMISNTKYKIGEDTGIYKRAFRVDGVWTYVFYSKRKRRFFSEKCAFYKYVSDNPQWKMERRSVNKIVQQLTGDVYFEW